MKSVTTTELNRMVEIFTQWTYEAKTLEQEAMLNHDVCRADTIQKTRMTIESMLGVLEQAKTVIVPKAPAKPRGSVLVAGSYASYAKRLGYAPLRGKSAEFEQLAHVLYDLNNEAKYLALYDPEGRYDSVIKERDAIAEQLKQVSKIAPFKEAEA